MARKTRTTTIEGTLKALKDVRADPLRSPWPLSPEQKPIWREILERRSREEWHKVDLYFAYEFADVLVQWQREQEQFDRESSIVEGKVNPRFQVIEQLSKRAIALGRYLRVHPSSDGREASIHFGARQAEKQAREILQPGILPDFLSRQ